MAARAAATAVLYSEQAGVAILKVNYPPVNALSHAVREGLSDGIARAEAATGVGSIVICGAGKTFPAGADITEFSTGGARKSPNLNHVLATMDTCTKPIVVAIHGTALGGGLEVSLGGHYRIAHSKARVGLPEVALGILPGAGGTQRLPRVAGVEVALDMITSGRHVKAAEALEAGIVDEIVNGSVEETIERAIEAAASLAGSDVSGMVLSTKAVPPHDPQVFARYAKVLAKKARGFQAPQNCVLAVQAAASSASFADGLAEERRLFAELASGFQAPAQQYFFFAERAAAKVEGVSSRLARPIGSVGVVGAGLMGSGIATACINAQIPVTLLDIKEEYVAKGMKAIERNYANQIKRGKMTAEEVAARLALVTPTTDYDALGVVDLVIEAVFENTGVKKKVFAALDAACKPEAILCSNTSYLDIDDIASATARPSQVVGMHFFSPAHIMKLMEGVRGLASSHETLATVMSFAKVIGKKPVLARNGFGFIGNRMLRPYATEASFLVLDGAEPAQVDRVMVEFGLPMGPFQIRDLAGLDIGYRIREETGMLDPANRPSNERYAAEADDRLYEEGMIGQKSGAGYYVYDAQRRRTPNPRALEIIGEVAAASGIVQRVVSDDEVRERCLAALANEGFRVLGDGIAQRPSDIDVVWVYGYGFPMYNGGPLYYAEKGMGLAETLAVLERYGAANPDVPHWSPAPFLVEAVKSGQTVAETWSGWEASFTSRL